MSPGTTVAVLAGPGNNGGDGYVVARHLANWGAKPVIYLLARPERITGDALLNLQVARNMGLPIVEAYEAPSAHREAIANAEVRVDAILGTGLTSEVRGVAAQAIAMLGEFDRGFTFGVDIPSGLSADTGQPLGVAVRCDATATFGALKRGHLLHPGPSYCGRVEVIDIGIPPMVLDAISPGLALVEPQDVRLPSRPRDSHKGDFGRVLVVAGSPTMAGAGLLAAHGAARAGAGVVTLDTVPEGCAASRARFPHVITRERSPEILRGPRADGFDAVAMGPGLGLDPASAGMVEAWVRGCELPMVLDADALTIIARSDPAGLLAAAGGPRVLTPHEGELARLAGLSRREIHSNRVEVAASMAEKLGSTILLKGNGTLVASPGDDPVALVPRGDPVLATGGSGDVLTGIVLAMLGQGLSPREAAIAAAWLHGLAGERCRATMGPAGVVAPDIADALPWSWAEAVGSHGREPSNS